MSKVTKKIAKFLLHTLAGVVLVAILLILAVAMAMSLPRVQTFVAQSATEWLNNKCGTNISVGAISLENITTLTAEELYVEDLAGDTLLWVGKLSGRIDREALLHDGRFVPYDAKVRDAKLYLVDDNNGEKSTNLDRLIEHISSCLAADTTSNGGDFSIRDVEAENFRFKLYNTQLAGKTPPTSIDYSDMDIMIASANFGEIAIEGADVVISNVSNLNATDKSGAELHESSFGMLRVGVGGLLDFKDIDFLSGGSHLVIPSLVLSASDWEEYKEFCDKVRLTLETEGSVLEPQSAGKWVHELGVFGVRGYDISGLFDGVVNDFIVDIGGTLYDSDIYVDGNVKDITLPSKLRADLNLDLSTTPAKVADIYQSILHQPLTKEVSLWLDKFNSLALVAHAKVQPEEVTTTATLSTDLGDVDIDGTLTYGSSTAFVGNLSGRGVEIGKLLKISDIGETDVAATGNVALMDTAVVGDIGVTIDSFNWKDYDFENINLHANLSESAIQASVVSNDPNVLLSAEGSGVLSAEEPEYNLNLNLERVNFDAIGLSTSEREAWLSCNMDASLRGGSLDRMIGRAMINNLTYATATDTLSTELVNISLAGGERDKSFSIYSPILDLEYRSMASYGDVIDYLTKTLPSQLPLGTHDSHNAEQAVVVYGDRLYAADDHTAVSVNIKEGEGLATVLYPNADLAPDSSLSIEFSPKSEEFNMLLESDYMSFDDVVVSHLRIEADGEAQSLNLEVECEELLAAELSIPDITLSAVTSSDNEVDVALFFSNADSALSGQLSAHATLARAANNAITVSSHITDSYIITPHQRWDILAPSIIYSPEGVAIDNFRIESANGSVDVNGEISKSNKKGLQLTLQNLMLNEWMGLIGGGTDNISGALDGKMELYSILSRPYGVGAIALSSLSVGGVYIDPLDISVEIPKRSENILFELNNSLQEKRLAEGHFNYSTARYDARVDVQELELSMLNPLLDGVAEDIGGKGAIDLNISGVGNQLNLDGTITIDNFGAKLGFTGARYSASQVALNFADNRATLSPVRIEDGEGGWADADGNLNLQTLSNVEYSLSLIPHNLVTIDLTEESGSPFYGKVFASGAAHLSSHGGNTEISGAISTGTGSLFCLPLTGNNDFAGADFVTFVDHSQDQVEESSELVARKKMEMMERKLKRIVGNTTIDMMLSVDTGTLLRLIIDPETENIIEARGVADLGITLDERKNEFAIRGDYEISEGVYDFNFQNIITKQFEINPNSYIRWNGSPLDANIDVGATYKLKTSLAPLLGGESTASRASTPVECIVDLTGSLANVDVSFDINVPNANTEYQSILSSYFSSQEMMATQFVYLLTLGNFYSDNSASQTNTASAAGTAIGFEFLADQVSRLVSNDAYKFDLKYRAIDDTSSSYSIDFQTEIIDDRLLLELEANVDTGDYYQLGDNSNQLSGGGAVTLLLDDMGDFYLRGFSRTIDRFDENQGLQENGVGLYYKRSFNRLSDLWRKKKSSKRDDSEKNGNFVATEEQEITPNENNKEK